ncbi:hypothetical protein BV25DRAFT_1871205 [Artomyces pyxidatus]|uniref:Uncharacterized protein n=1 Tax=Artomyces pyxidatus TaxID=48021 RepID=A0ACB8SW35_9AGAM|nr:hypothetical protein BV25DRAFT_1871205 [Artomyces pyxidatus]
MSLYNVTDSVILVESATLRFLMEVLNARASLLSNFEVLTLLRELESDYLARTKTALRIKKEEEAAGHNASQASDLIDGISENLRTLEVEAIQHLSAEYQPTRAQTAASISRLVKDLAPFGLTKAEKLQIVNLAPTEAVELYVIVEELEDRLGERMEDVLSVVRASLVDPPDAGAPIAEFVDESLVYDEGVQEYDEEQWTQNVDDIEFMDAGEGAGVEGDLDVEED